MVLSGRVAGALFLIAFLRVELSAQQGSAPASRGEQIMQAGCTGCHELDVVARTKRSAAQWQQIVANMVERGAPVFGAELQILVDFLSASYGSTPASSPSSSLAQPPIASEEPGSDAHGRQILQEVCSVCHELAFVYESRRSPSEWEELVNDMMGRGAAVLEGERDILLGFLARHYGPENPKTNINRASAQQLVTLFGLTPAEADAIVLHKQQKGTILGWEDLRKIPGLDVSKLEAKKQIVSFF